MNQARRFAPIGPWLAMFSITPTMNSNTTKLVPPKLMNGNGNPFVGKRPVTTAMFNAA